MGQITIAELRNMKGQNGLAFLNCAMDPQELLDSVNNALTHGGILLNQSKLKEVKSFPHDGVVDLIVPFGDAELEPTKLIIWQMLIYHDCRGVFLSDYIHNELDTVQEESATPWFGEMKM